MTDCEMDRVNKETDEEIESIDRELISKGCCTQRELDLEEIITLIEMEHQEEGNH